VDIEGTPGALNDLAKIKSENKHIKTVLSVGGGGEASSIFAQIARDPKLCQAFANSARQFLDKYSLNGIDSKSHLSVNT
jgi:chitinase